ncbi:isocitrate/isopropylmalate dehydrogenase family protein [Prauserella muralis]|uniref:3-isopropylmalate dehydrogenase n=1 Tax=Prauserella muralis TaxID=588067 RepID=A0A2V4BE28_9PSEU|nr:isocitrate/isopropylmalate family dehydrogenase [Prauserella muralis]PXY27869.1 3-isopropylmalate dehydrogenase [Prauserella muralis]TWE22360.1 3-isopropylmalate dehydrogenase [Prauserella muralis]
MAPEQPGRTLSVAVIRGDGIGPELVESALTVLRAVAQRHGITLDVREEPAGAEHYRRTGRAVDPGALERLATADAVLKGPVGLPDVRHPDGTEAGLLGGVLRTGLDTFANVRPVRLLPGVRGATRHEPGEIDYVLVRENTEGLYASRGAGVVARDAAADQLLVTRTGTRRVVRYAFELARRRAGGGRRARPEVVCVDKSNVLRSFALFRAVFDEVAADYPDVAARHLYADAAAHDLVAHPERFDVLVMENFLGDILSDLAAATVGGLGMCGAANIGDGAAYFEPIHGSAPSLAGRGLANPTSQLLSLALLLEHTGHDPAAAAVRAAVERAYADGAVALTAAGSPATGTASVTAAVLERL